MTVDTPASETLAVAPTPPPATPTRGGSLIRSSMVFSSLSLISKFMGLARDLVITAKLGASGTIEADAYNTALAFPNLFRRIFAEGAFASAFVPAYARALERDGEEKADILAADAMATLAAATIALTLVAQLTMPWLMYVINPGYANDPAKFKMAVLLTQISMPYLPCMAIYAHLSGVLQARGKFAITALAPTLLNLIMLAAVLPQKSAQSGALAASWAIIGAGVAQAALLSWGVHRSGAQVHWRLPRLTPDIKALIMLAVPGAIAGSATQINIFISSLLASYVAGARSWLAVCDRLYQLPISLVAVAIGVALLPRLSRAVHAGDKQDAQATMDQAVVFCLALSLPAAAALTAMPYYLIDGLFTRGAFTHYDAQQTAAALFAYGWGVPAFVLKRILEPAFFARQDTKAPMRFALISVVVNIVLGVILFKIVGVWGIAAATSVATWVNVGQMVTALARRGVYAPTPKTWSRLIRLAVASGALGLLLALTSHFRAAIEAPLAGVHLGPFHAKELVILAVMALAGAAYPVLLFASGGLTLAEARAAIRRRPADPAPTPLP